MKTDRGRWITLTRVEIVVGVLVGAWRQLRAILNGKKDSHGFKGDPWETHIQGACAEMAAYKAIGAYWSPNVDKRKEPGGDGGPFEVRRRGEDWHDLLIRDDDLVGAPHILAIGSLPTFRVVGWIWGHEARRPEWRDNKGEREACWWVPQEELHDLADIRWIYDGDPFPRM
jgi:hypothetical protein